MNGSADLNGRQGGEILGEAELSIYTVYDAA